jgi:hypothetical protein
MNRPLLEMADIVRCARWIREHIRSGNIAFHGQA